MCSASCSVFIGSFKLRSLNCPWYEVCIFFFHFAESILRGPIVVCNVLWIKWFWSNTFWELRKIWTVCFCDCFHACHVLFFFFLQTWWGLWRIGWIQAFLFLLASLEVWIFLWLWKFELFGFLIVLVQVKLCFSFSSYTG